MRNFIPVAGLVLIGITCSALAITHENAAGLEDYGTRVHTVLPMEDKSWHDAPPGLPPGGRFAVISGDPAKVARFMMRVELPPGYAVLLYRQLNEENIVVLAGTLEVGSGSTFDETALHPLSAGSFVTLPANEPHFATTRHGATLQIFGMGPFAIEYVDAPVARRAALLAETSRSPGHTGNPALAPPGPGPF